MKLALKISIDDSQHVIFFFGYYYFYFYFVKCRSWVCMFYIIYTSILDFINTLLICRHFIYTLYSYYTLYIHFYTIYTNPNIILYLKILKFELEIWNEKEKEQITCHHLGRKVYYGHIVQNWTICFLILMIMSWHYFLILFVAQLI